ncbi:NAD(P)-dependent alcohol dehydrogenase, partial [Pseudomonas syringae pv. tagetis]
HILVGLIAPVEPPVHAALLVMSGRVLAGWLIGGIADCLDVVHSCADKELTCVFELIDIRNIYEANERILAGDVN